MDETFTLMELATASANSSQPLPSARTFHCTNAHTTVTMLLNADLAHQNRRKMIDSNLRPHTKQLKILQVFSQIGNPFSTRSGGEPAILPAGSTMIAHILHRYYHHCFKPGATHLISKKLFSPRSAPKPASVTPYSLSDNPVLVAMILLVPQ